MKVLHVLDTSIPDSAGYTTRGYYLVMHQQRLGWQPIVLTSERFSNLDGKPQEMIESVQYYRTSAADRKITSIPFFSELDEIRVLRNRVAEVARKEKVDVIHAHSPSLIGSACLTYCKANKVPLVYEIRAFWEDAAVDRGAFTEKSFMYLLRRFHETRVVKQADRVVAICDGIKEDLLQRGVSADKISVIRNGVDCDLFQPQDPNLALKSRLQLEGKKILGFVGSFFHFEGIQDLIRAMEGISRRDNQVVLLLVGSGQMYLELEMLTEKLGLKDIVKFVGRVPHEEVKEYYSIIDVLVYPRIRKRITELVTPLKPLEAMAMGKTVLMSDVGGLRELVDDDGAASIYSAENIEELATISLQLCNDESKRAAIGARARRSVQRGWGWLSRAEQGIALYNSILKKD